MARIRPGTMPVRLPGVAQVIQQMGPKRWSPNQIQVMREAERIRKRQEEGKGVTAKEIAEWAQLAQIIMKDDTLVGGLVNMLSRKSREGAAKERQKRLDQLAALPKPSFGPTPGATATPAPTLAPGQLPPTTPAEPWTGMVPAPTPSPTQVQQAPAPAPEPTRASMYQDILREEGAARDAEVAEYKRIARERQLTVSDLYGLAATAKSPEAVRTLMAMVPTVVEQDPAFAPRSLSELLFGGQDRGAGISRELIDIWGQTQRVLRGEDYDRKVARRSKTEERLTLLKEREAEKAALTQKRLADAAASKAMTEPRVSEIEAKTELHRARTRLANAKATKAERRYMGAVGKRSGSVAKSLPEEEQLILAQYARYIDTGDKATLPGTNAFRGLGAGEARAKVNSLVLSRHRGKKTSVSVRQEIDAIEKHKRKVKVQTSHEMTWERKLNYYEKELVKAKKELKAWEDTRATRRKQADKGKIEARIKKLKGYLKTVREKLGLGDIGEGGPLANPQGAQGAQGAQGGGSALDKAYGSQ